MKISYIRFRKHDYIKLFYKFPKKSCSLFPYEGVLHYSWYTPNGISKFIKLICENPQNAILYLKDENFYIRELSLRIIEKMRQYEKIMDNDISS